MKQPKNPLATLDIEYLDAEGNSSRRVIDVINGNQLYLIAYCRMRKAERTFHPEKIVKCKDVGTGEAIPDVVAYIYKKGLKAGKEDT